MSARLRDNVTRMFTSFAGKDSQLVIPRPYIDFCKGDILAALLLSQILYWADRTDDTEGWFAKSYDDWQTELGMTEYQIKRAIHGDKRSKDGFHGLCTVGIETRLKPSRHYGGAPALHYRVNNEALSAAVHAYLNPPVHDIVQNAVPNIVQNGKANIVKNGIPNIVQDQYTETIAETIAEKEIDRSRVLLLPDPIPAELQTLPDDDPTADAERIAGAHAVIERLKAEGYDPAAPPAPLPPAPLPPVDSTHLPYHVANGLGMTGFSDPYWTAYQNVNVVGQSVETRVPVNASATIRVLASMDAKPDEVQRAVEWQLTRRIAKTTYRFEWVPDDVRQYRESLLPPLERDAQIAVAVQAGWQYATGSDANNRLVDFLSGNVRGDMHKQDWGKFQFRTDPLSAAEVGRFVSWYKAQFNDRKTPPSTAKTLRDRIEDFRAQQTTAANTPPPKLNVLTTPTRSPEESDSPEAKAAAIRAAREQLSGVLR